MHVPHRREFLGSGLGLAGLAATATAADSALPDERAAVRPQAAPLAQQYTIVHHNADREQYVEGPGLVRHDDGSLTAVVPVVPRSEWSEARRVERSRTHVVRSTDGGRTWHEASVLPYYSAVPWLHGGALYLFANKGGTKHRNDDLLLLRSDDRGATWSKPATLFQGHYWNCHTGLVVEKDRLYWAVDDLAAGPRGPCVIAGDLARDPLDPAAWRISPPTPYFGVPKELTNPKFGKPSGMYLEPNVIDVGGRKRMLLAVKPNGQTTANLTAVFDVEDDGRRLAAKFVQYYPMPGGQLKFCILRDEVSQLFWATCNFVVDSQGVFDWYARAGGKYRYAQHGGNDRRFLMLMYGLDGLNWFPAGCVAQAADVTQSFMYARPVVDGDDLAIIARSNVAGPNHHDADTATFHRVRDFRKLALNLFPATPG